MADKVLSFYDSYGGTYIDLPKTKYKLGYDEVSEQKIMQSGKIKFNLTGYRPIIKAEFGYIPAADVQKLVRMILAGQLIQFKYEKFSDGTQTTGYFHVKPPTLTVFRYDENGNAVWSDVTLELEGEEVV